MGRVFEYAGANGGHQFCMHYLDNMFPLKKCKDGLGVGGSGFEGCVDVDGVVDGVGVARDGEGKGDGDEAGFMDEEVQWWGRGASREGLESSSLSASGSFNFYTKNDGDREGEEEEDGEPAAEVGVNEMSPVSASSTINALRGEFENGRGFTKKERYKKWGESEEGRG
ncbi:hypothetical protein LHYA1_G004920 [Lachnellula hyalina]|uniref:Uncharacterized protein n=1 Tax=Lachnellula hyalina TaxID=1316788 RepID=A0A8H8R0R9_9HELO|nr:uncharacterized protein LHYA1_G004920 [Lachnellula hyalina]TVY26228.1 hypothetical protein LHYA1_G004920 [Lachnellula hyalina]